MEIKIKQYFDNLDDSYRLSAQLNSKEVGKLILHKEFDEYNYSEEIDGKIVYNMIETLIEEYSEFYTLEYLEVDPNFRGNGIANKLLKYFQDNFTDVPCLLRISCYSVFDESLKKEMNQRILPGLYQKYGFRRIGLTNYYCNV